MTSEERSKLIIDGSSFADLEIGNALDLHTKGHWDFLTRVVPGNPWIAGLAAIIGIVWLGSTPWVQAFAIIGITVITVFSTWKWRSHERSKKTDELGNVREDTCPDRKSQGKAGQRLSVGSDPPIS